jgi:diguanylate cyclase (GGDEF)-like protein
MKRHISRRLLIGFLVAAAVLAANALISHRTIVGLMKSEESGGESLVIMAVLGGLRIEAADFESARRAYIVSGKRDHLDRASQILSRSRELIQRLRGLTERTPDRIHQVELLDAVIGNEAESVSALIEIHQKAGSSSAIRAIRAMADGGTLGRAHEVISSLTAEESEIMKRRSEQSKDRVTVSVVTAWVANGFNMGLLALLIYLAHREIRERRQSEALLRFTATHDPLTNLPNRIALAERGHSALTAAKETSSHVAVLFVDLDRFKNINDTLGHEVGDLLLKEVASRLVECVRRGDIVVRHGGDEFVVLIEGFAHPANLVRIAESILEGVAKPMRLFDKEFHLTASIGISICPENGSDMPTLLKNADIAMYRAKDRGKNNYQFYSARENKHSVERLDMEAALRHAVDRGDLTMHYQPKVDASTCAIVGVEGLLRWQHPRYGLVMPDQIVPLVEELGLIGKLGVWTLRTACVQQMHWLRQGLPPLRVAVNLSARQFVDSDLVADVRAVLDQTGLDPRWLELEITEGMMMHDPMQSQAALKALKAMGVYLSVDDFGTGYSSMMYLKRFPLDCLKIDQSFVRGVPVDESDVAITKTIITMAHSLRLSVIAEGVETQEQLNFLVEQKCDGFQGYRFGKPMPAELIADFVRKHQASLGGRVLKFQAGSAFAGQRHG